MTHRALWLAEQFWISNAERRSQDGDTCQFVPRTGITARWIDATLQIFYFEYQW
jgi:hypothetical protein